MTRYDTPMAPPLSPFVKLRQTLLRWYARHKRDLPWRHTRDPYKIWVSEIMLQQTQVATVIPYYERWLKAFPTLSSLARAPLSKALELWAGLGYYRRVRMFHQAVRHLLENAKGIIPETSKALKELPGIGRYTAGAIASIAFGEKTPVLDGNVMRILTRIFAIPQSIDKPATLEKLWSLSADLLPATNPGNLNQALMELGATVCYPSAPQCPRCPVRSLCAAHKKGEELSYPVRSAEERYKKLRMSALVLKNSQGEVWLEQQPEQGRWGGLWMFPFWENKNALLEEIKSLNLKPVYFLTVPHAFTKYRIQLRVYTATCEKNSETKRPRGKWFPIKKLVRIACPSPHKKIVRALMANQNL